LLSSRAKALFAESRDLGEPRDATERLLRWRKKSGDWLASLLDMNRFALCTKNTDHPASLERRKVYQVLGDRRASKHGQLRVIDESGEDYLYPEEYFIPIKLPQAAERAVLRST